jgi:hypothetical protein
MDWDAIGAVAESFGALAVAATLIYLAYQLRQSNKLGRLEAMQALADAWLFTGWEIAGNKELAELLAKVDEGAVQSDFDSAENYQLFSFSFAADNNWALRFNQLHLGILKPEDYAFPSPMNRTYNSNYHREVWPTFRAEFSDEFVPFWERRFGLILD